MEISIIIVNWNSGPLLGDCLRSIRSFGSKHVGSVVVVDNGSTDDSLEGIEHLCAHDLAIIRNAQNVGFARACNAGAKRATTNFLLFLNPDARLSEHTLANALKAMTNKLPSRVAIVGAKLINSSGQVSRSCVRFPNTRRFLAHSLGIDRLAPKLGYSMADWDHTESRDVDHVIGAFLLIRTAAFVEAGGFDERFFVYLEDLDLSREVSRHGWCSWYESTAVAFHVGGGTSSQVKPQRLFYSLRSRVLYAKKHLGSFGFAAVTASTLLIEPWSRLFAACMRRDLAMATETRDAYRWLWRWFLTGCRQNGAVSPPG
jgi:GT2 family glycosyltransferase